MKPQSVSRAEARELARRARDNRRTGGTSHDAVVAEVRLDMARELARMAREYDGSPARAKELLEALVIAEAEGVESCAEIRQSLAARARRHRAA